MTDPRTNIAKDIWKALTSHYGYLGRDFVMHTTETTSGCPMVRLTIMGQTFNITITRARS